MLRSSVRSVSDERGVEGGVRSGGAEEGRGGKVR